MARKAEPIPVQDAVYKLQLSLLECVPSEAHLFAAGSIISRADYSDVVEERSISNLCGYPLCRNPLPSDRSRKARFRISLKEHRVYDLTETDMYCSSACVVESKAFAGSLHDERCPVVNSQKLDEVMRMFEDLTLLEGRGGLGKMDGDLGMAELKIQENAEGKSAEVSFEEWRGSSGAIEGYVPRMNMNSKRRKASTGKNSKPSFGEDSILNEVHSMGPVMMGDEYTISKTPSGSSYGLSDKKTSEGKAISKEGSIAIHNKPDNDMDFVSTIIVGEDYATSKTSSESQNAVCNRKLKTPAGKRTEKKPEEELSVKQISSALQNISLVKMKGLKDQLSTLEEMPLTSSPSETLCNVDASAGGSLVEKPVKSSETTLKPSLKSVNSMKLSRSVTWADDKSDSAGGRDLCETREIEDRKSSHSVSWTGERSDNALNRNYSNITEKEMASAQDPAESVGLDTGSDTGDEDKMLRFASAEACALALTQAAEAVASGENDPSDAVSESGIIILPPHVEIDQEEYMDEDDLRESEVSLKWPPKPGMPQSDFFDSGDSWYDAPPDGFSLVLSPFATMWMSLFAWISASSLAYIYGQDESFCEDYLTVNGREYPRKVVLADGRSSEIKMTLAGCLARALPGLIADLRLPIPISTLETGMGRLLETMSFTDALPAFRVKQWQLIVLLFLEALSVNQIPALTPHMTNNRNLFHKVRDGAQITGEEYEVLKDLIIPLGRAPQFSAQSGG